MYLLTTAQIGVHLCSFYVVLSFGRIGLRAIFGKLAKPVYRPAKLIL